MLFLLPSCFLHSCNFSRICNEIFLGPFCALSISFFVYSMDVFFRYLFLCWCFLMLSCCLIWLSSVLRCVVVALLFAPFFKISSSLVFNLVRIMDYLLCYVSGKRQDIESTFARGALRNGFSNKWCEARSMITSNVHWILCVFGESLNWPIGRRLAHKIR